MQAQMLCVAVEYVDKSGEKVEAGNLSGGIPCQYHCLTTCPAAYIRDEGSAG